MRLKGFEGMTCSIAGVLEAVGDRWAFLILRDLTLGLSKYEDLKRSTGITDATLSARLKHLGQNGLIERRVYRTRPARHEYVPSARGWDMVLVIQALAQLGDKWGVAGSDGPPLEFVNTNGGGRVRLKIIDERTDATVRQRDVRPKAGPGADEKVRWRVGKFAP
ncbi:winged helix-turn-helix transcriptional regulator [Bradyrhizobium vignae]|uniref:HxlR family transcriptional regulator n=1 Tax=Bradyrhizobium vignae TaxID=1549949 RepID=A0A2U3PV31_9BRAD|nr:helix-turn-helix domain-containing protein [Bradyrhizobium vignae]SPP92984.1 HxlR family transcriptional regulator [Bradyrhizobium vignae]